MRVAAVFLLASVASAGAASEPEYASAGGGKPLPCPARAIRIPPGASIQEAVDAAGPGAVFCLGAGVHRGQAVRPLDYQTFQGEAGAVLDGSVPLTGFRERLGLWVAQFDLPPPQPTNNCLKSSPVCDYPNVVFLDGLPLSNAASLADLRPGSALLEPGQGRVLLAENPEGRSPQIARARFAFKSFAVGVTIRNVTVEKFASPPQYGAIHAQSASGWTIEDCDVRLNSGAGVALGDNGVVRRCRVDDNGQIGVKGVGKGIAVEHNRVRRNNFRGFDPSWEAGGVKLFASRDAVLRGNEVAANAGGGLWCDTDCRRIDYVDNVVSDNNGIGISHEISFDAHVHGNRLRHNGSADSSWFWGADIALAGSSEVTVDGNQIAVAPNRCGIVMIDQNRPDERGGRYKTAHNVVVNNEMTFEGRPCAGGISDASPGAENFGIIERGNNQFDSNMYYVPEGVTLGRFAWGREIDGWDEWRALGPEAHGKILPADVR